MPEASKTLLEEALESWEYARHGVLAEADVMPDEGYDFRPHPKSRSVRELLIHIIGSGLMMSGELSNPEGDFTRHVEGGIYEHYARHLRPDASPSEIRELLRTTLEEGVAKLRGAGEVAMLQSIRRFDGELWTRLAWMHHGIAHEEYHRGQIALYVRLQGIVPALTRLIHGDAAE